MKVILITYDLKKPGQNYTELYNEIKGCGEWKHPLESVWVIKIEDDIKIETICDKLLKKMDNNDNLFVVDITNNHCNGWLSKNFWTWLNQ